MKKKTRDHYTSLVTHMYFTSNLYVGACELKSVLPKLKRNEHVVIFNFYLTIVTIKTPIFLAEHCMPHLQFYNCNIGCKSYVDSCKDSTEKHTNNKPKNTWPYYKLRKTYTK